MIEDTVLLTLAKLVENYKQYEDVRKILDFMMVNFVTYYQDEDLHTDFSFFFGYKREVILECIGALRSLVSCGGQRCIDDILTSPYKDFFLKILIAKFEQKARFLLLHNLKDKPPSECRYNYYEEILALGDLLSKMMLHTRIHSELVSFDFIENLYKAL